MSKLTSIKIKYDDNTFSDDIPISVSIENVKYDDNNNLKTIIGNTNFETKGSIKEQLDLINTEINDIEQFQFLKYYQIPEYFNDQLNSAISKINNDINGSRSTMSNNLIYQMNYPVESFIFITDTHWKKNKKHSPGLIKQILNNTPISTVVHGGDTLNNRQNNKKNAIKEIKDYNHSIVNIPCYNYLPIFGNHDSNSHKQEEEKDRILSKKDQYNVLYENLINYNKIHWSWEEQFGFDLTSTTSVRNDYYVDFPITKTRFLCLDWTGASFLTSSARKNWIKSVLEKNDDYNIIIFHHGVWQREQIDDVKVYDSETNSFNYIPIGNITAPNSSNFKYDLYKLCKPYQEKIVAYIMGHVHSDGVFYYDYDQNQQYSNIENDVVTCPSNSGIAYPTPTILCGCDTFENPPVAGFTLREGTTEEQCFDAIVVDYYQKKLKLTRIGRHSDSQRIVPGYRNNLEVSFSLKKYF